MSIRTSLVLTIGALSLALATSDAVAQGSAKKSGSKAPAKAGAKTVEASPAVPDGGVPRYIRPETPEQRRDRIGSNDDPGLDPDEKKIFSRYGKQYTIIKFEREFAKYMPEPGIVRPLAQANFTREIYQENDKYVWVWNEIIEPEVIDPNANQYPEYSPEHIQYFQELREEFSTVDAPAAGMTIRFEESSTGLPTSGSWRNGGAVADMNRDGFVDLVAPPQRGPADVPAIFLGDGKGNWTRWPLDFPRRFNYGSVVVADFNKDKNPDMAFSIHLTGVAVFLGNGKGQFREVDGLKEDYYPTRRLVTADVDADGWMDFVAITEGPVGIGRDAKKTKHGHIRAYLNRQKGRVWEGLDIADRTETVGGDFLAVGHFNGDSLPDFAGASIYFNSTKTIYLSKGKNDYEPVVQGLLVPARSYYAGVTAAPFMAGAKTDDLIVSYMRQWPSTVDPKLVPEPPTMKISGLDLITFANGEAKRVPILRWEGSALIPGVASGDFDGDGKLDLTYADRQKVTILLGDGVGNFKRAEIEGLQLPPQRSYDLRVADLNGDRKPDLMMMYESDGTTAFSPKNGSIRVYLNRGSSSLK